MTGRIVGFCGIVCSQCPAFVATVKDNNEERKRIAEKWSEEFNMEVKPEEISCDGCITHGGRHIGYCEICEIRRCGIEKRVENCAYCEQYTCEKLENWFKNVKEAKTTLDEIKKSLEER